MQAGDRRKPGDYSFLRTKQPESAEPQAPKALTMTDYEFLARMDGDIDDRRRTAFITELRARRHACHHARARARQNVLTRVPVPPFRRQGPALPSVDARGSQEEVPDSHADRRADYQIGETK